MDEAQRIETLLARVPHPEAPEGPGDDAAALRAPPHGRRVITTDVLVEGTHFLRAHPPAWLGWKALAVNLADVAAMGARPEGFLLDAAVPSETPNGWWERLGDGLGAGARHGGVQLCGGDVVRSERGVVLAVTAWGRTEAEALLRRSGGRPGDVAMVAGPVGRSARGLASWLRVASTERWGAEPPEDADACLRAHLRPEPPLEAGPWALRSGANAGMDLSDGLALDADRLARASGLELELELEALPADPHCGRATPDERAAGGEDHGLLVLVPEARREAFAEAGFVGLGRARTPAEGRTAGLRWRRAGRPATLRASAHGHFGR